MTATRDHLYLVREEHVPVEDLRPGDRIVLPSGRPVMFDRLDECDDGYIVRWWRPAEHGEPGHKAGRGRDQVVGDERNGRYYGSLSLQPCGSAVRVTRG